MKILKKYYFSVIILILAICSVTNFSDKLAFSYLDNSMQRALAAFAIARGINSAISVAQSTQVAMQPAGVGVSVSFGELLDPINDLIEWFSSIILSSIAAIGFQKLFLEIISYSTIRYVISSILLIYSILNFIDFDYVKQKNIKNIFLLIIFIRFGFPIVATVNDYVFKKIILSKYSQSISEVEKFQSGLNNLQIKNNTEQTWYDKFVDNLSVLELNFKNKIDSIKSLFAKTGKELTDLAVIFIFDAIVLPLSFFLILGFFFKRLM